MAELSNQDLASALLYKLKATDEDDYKLIYKMAVFALLAEQYGLQEIMDLTRVVQGHPLAPPKPTRPDFGTGLGG